MDTNFNPNYDFGANPNEPSSGKIDFEDLKFLLKRKYQNFLDRTTIYPRERWLTLAVLCLLYCLRIYATQGYAVVTYLLGLFYLNHVMLYLSPLDDFEE